MAPGPRPQRARRPSADDGSTDRSRTPDSELGEGPRPRPTPTLEEAEQARDTGEAEGRGGGGGDPTDDHALIRRAQAGDQEAFGELVRRHEGRALRVARNLVAGEEDARDLAQDAFLRVYKSLERFDFKHEFTTWLYRIVTNLAIDFLRKRRPLRSTASFEDDDEAPGERELVDHRDERPSDRMESEETADEVRACLETLAPHFQSVLVLRELEGLPCTEIADIVGATHVTVRWRLHRGRKLFQEEWERRLRAREAEPGGEF